jgi:hypothetical protein
MGMAKWFFIVCAFLMIVAILCPLIRADDNFKPTMPTRPLRQDANNNGIADALDQEVADKTASGQGDDIVSVIVMLEYEPSNVELGAFAAAGGNVTAGPWNLALYGFGGSIQYDKISTFAQNCLDLIFIEKNAGRMHLATSIDSETSIDPSSQMMPVCIAVPDYSAQILLFVMTGIVSIFFSVKKIAKNKKRSYLLQSP